jgi:predicted secreted hydrolase
MSTRRTASRSLVGLVLAVLAVAGCSASGGPILANPTAAPPSIVPASPAPSAAADPQPIVFPRDDGPHDRLTEWWYVTGHLAGSFADGPERTYGFEYVIFRAERGAFPTSWASHLAITDETGDGFLYTQRAEVGPQVDHSPRGADGLPTGFDLRISGLDPTDPTTVGRDPWIMDGTDAQAKLVAIATPSEATAAGAERLGLDLDLVATKPPALHDHDGWIDFGEAGGSYYYTTTAMGAAGWLYAGFDTVPVDGTAWFDHQWGDFISVGGGGWDWFAVNLADGTDLTLSLVRDADGSYPLVYGTLVDAAGRTRHLERDAFQVTVTRRWTSPTTGADYPAGWQISIPSESLEIGLVPTVADQELDTRATTGVVYWEGSQVVTASRGGQPLVGQAYVELTGYAPTR